MSGKEKTVFISYRRETSRYAARAIFMDMRQHGYDVFMDVQSIDSGEFERIILHQIAARAHFVLVLAPGSLERTVNSRDWLRREIEHAIELQRNIVPVLVNGFSFTNQKTNLYGRLEKLPCYNALNMPNDYFEEAMQRLRERFLKQPVYGPVSLTSSADQKDVNARIEATVRQSVPTNNQLSAENHHNRAFELQRQGNYEAAIDELNRAIALKSDFSETYSLRGYCHKQKGNYPQAISDYTRSLEIGNPEPEIPYHSRGIVRTKLGDWVDALTDFNAALRANPRYGYALTWRAAAHEHFGNIDAAIVDYDAYLALGNDMPVDHALQEKVRRRVARLKSERLKSRIKWTWSRNKFKP